jgi:uncharacterized protein YggE
MSRFRLVVVGAGLAVFLLAVQLAVGQWLFNQTPALAQTTATPAPGTVSVQGVGQTSAAPDIAHLIVGVESIGPDVGKAISDVNTKQAAIVDKLKGLGIAEKDIQTVNFSVNVDRSKPGQPGTNDGPVIYNVVNTANFTIRKIDQIAAVIDAAVSAGANNIYGVNLGISDSTQLANDARTKAVADAKQRADTLAKAAGMKLGRVISISEGFAAVPQPIFAADARASSSAIQTGQLQVTAQVQVVYALEAQ